jgi:hypothetical protein
LIDVGVGFVADDEALLAIEHRQPAAHVIERGLEARVQLLQHLVALERLAQLRFERCQTMGFASGGWLGHPHGMLAFRLARAEGQLERAMTHEGIP